MIERVVIELILLQIDVHGPYVVAEHADVLRETYRNDKATFIELSYAAIAAGMNRRDLMTLVLDELHTEDCACWTCVIRLHAEAAVHQARMRVKFDNRSR